MVRVSSRPTSCMGRAVEGPSATTANWPSGAMAVCAVTSALMPAEARNSVAVRSMMSPRGVPVRALSMASDKCGAERISMLPVTLMTISSWCCTVTIVSSALPPLPMSAMNEVSLS